MLSITTVLFTSLLAPAQQDPITDLIQRAESLPPSQILLLADEVGSTLDAKQIIDCGKRILTASDKAMLALGQVQTYADIPLHIEDLASLLQPEYSSTTVAVLRVFCNPAFFDSEQPSTALHNWASTLDPSVYADSWTEAQLCLAINAPATIRRGALRALRSECYSSDNELANKAILALARTPSPLSAAEINILSAVARGLDEQAMLAESLLSSVEQEQRFRSKIDSLQKLYASHPQSNPQSSSDLDVLEELLIRSQNQHMEGGNFTRQELIGAAADGMLRKLDPHSTFFSSEEYNDFMYSMKQEYGGIGAYVNTVDGIFTITRPIYSGPAYGAGLLSEDRILSVDGWDTIDQPNDEIIKRLKGPPGTQVQLEVVRRGWSEPHFVDVTRERIKVPVVQSDILPGDIIYIELLSFSEDVAQRLFDVIADAKEKGPINGVVLDMRNNPGGYLNEAISICDLFLPKDKLIVTTKSRMGSDKPYKTRARAFIDSDIPLTILINKYSASASEIVAGALSIHNRATTVGERSFGKGSVQNIFAMTTSKDEEFTDTKNNGNRNGIHDSWEDYDDANDNGQYDYGDRVKLTIAYYYLPDGSTIHTLRDHEGKVTRQGGVGPDIESAFEEVPFIEAREISHLLDEKVIQNYAKKLFEEYTDSAIELAINDMHETSAYPGWSEFYVQLETELDEQSVRRWVRRYLRSRVSDARGEVFPGNGFVGDYVEDPVLRAAIMHLLSNTDIRYQDLPEYANLVASSTQ
jgi:C-terminal peptidase prc